MFGESFRTCIIKSSERFSRIYIVGKSTEGINDLVKYIHFPSTIVKQL